MPTSSTTSTTIVRTPVFQEAEDCAFTGDVRLLTRRDGYSGRGYIRVAEGDKVRVDCSVTIARAGKYLLRIRVASPTGASRDVVVNGFPMALLVPLTDPESWSNGVTAEYYTELSAGSNAISLVPRITLDGIIEIDRIEIQALEQLTEQTPPKEQAKAPAYQPGS